MDQFVGIEAGGTKFVCAYGTGPNDLHHIEQITTQTPEITLPAVIDYIHKAQQQANIKAVGLACFGPLDLNRHSKTYGYITTPPKLAWQYCDIVGIISQQVDLPIGFDTDVNGAAIAEYYWGAGQHLTDFVYTTVGTGIGSGSISNGKIVHGAMHPETGHIFIPHDTTADPFPGVCPYHQDCLEGLASGPALEQRWHIQSAQNLPEDHPGWDLEAKYLGCAMANYTFVLSPQRLIIGGGVMRQQHLLPKIRRHTLAWINQYVKNATVENMENYIVKPDLEQNSGICGGIALARQVHTERELCHE